MNIVAEAGGIMVRGEFLVRKWTTKDGLPQNTITSIVQTKDGYLWLGTFGGLVRSDGMKFRVFNTANTPSLRSNRIYCLYEDTFGTLWIGTQTGEIYTIRDGVLKPFLESEAHMRKIVRSIVQDKSGDLFIASGLGLQRLRYPAGRMPEPSSRKLITSLSPSKMTVDPSGRVWVRLEKEFFILEGDKTIPGNTSLPGLPEKPVTLAFGSDGSVLAANSSSLIYIGNKGAKKLLDLKYKIHGNSHEAYYIAGTFWFVQGSQLSRIKGDRLETTELSGIVDGGSRGMFIDRESNVWIASNTDGLVRLSKRRVSLLSELTGLPIKETYSVTESADGSKWIAGRALYHLARDRTESFDGRPSANRLSLIKSVGIDPAGKVWSAGDTGLFHLEDEGLVPVPAFKGVSLNVVFFDRGGTLWMGGERGLWRRRGGNFEHFQEADGLVDDAVQTISQAADGTLWIGTIGGISLFANDRFINFEKNPFLGTRDIRDIHHEGDTKWIATYGAGMFKYRDGDLSQLTSRKGLPDDSVSRILIDKKDRFWILTNRGVLMIDRLELERVLHYSESTLAGVVFNESEGMPTSEANGGHQPAGILSNDGRLWFPMIKDMIIINPDSLKKTSPLITIETAVSHGTEPEGPETHSLIAPGDKYQVPYGLRNLEISYTAFSYRDPDGLRFFYRLDGLEKDWVYAGNRRTAFYPYLPAGKYVFLVKAINSDGVWTRSPAELEVVVPQVFYLRWWFLTLMTILGILFVAAIISLRMLQLRKRNALQRAFSRRLIDAHESERQRISAELHDGLGHYFLAIKNLAASASDLAKINRDTEKRLDEISMTAGRAIEETRRMVNKLAPQHLDRFGLTATIADLIDSIQDSTALRIASDLDDIDDVFDINEQINIYRIVQECLANVVKHSESECASVIIKRDPGRVTVVIEDEGKGFGSSFPGRNTHLKSGFGIRNIEERVQLLSGKLTIDSAQGKGTVVRIVIDVEEK